MQSLSLLSFIEVPCLLSVCSCSLLRAFLLPNTKSWISLPDELNRVAWLAPLRMHWVSSLLVNHLGPDTDLPFSLVPMNFPTC